VGVTNLISVGYVGTVEVEGRAYFMRSVLPNALADRCRGSCYPMGRRIGAVDPVSFCNCIPGWSGQLAYTFTCTRL